VGDDAGAGTYADGADAVVELDGALVTPAFVDAHVHATSTGLALEGLDLSGATSLKAALNAVERHATKVRGRAIIGHGWDETAGPSSAHRPGWRWTGSPTAASSTSPASTCTRL
jgi:predicted amidohydrolase YtcJ